MLTGGCESAAVLTVLCWSYDLGKHVCHDGAFGFLSLASPPGTPCKTRWWMLHVEIRGYWYSVLE